MITLEEAYIIAKTLSELRKRIYARKFGRRIKVERFPDRFRFRLT